ncbi:sigma-70 family RNA polymerase sigma factor [Paractinoplanes atraurantiacus]|uniref:RNA polymerase sigma-70 factor, ECF subfamily n=1 Tax=Paractinoplanes atraurantiacus TaxID=1036182 RepID=A0A285JWJ8_9ACTN|nr:sigma-70 family RNA polymerase sigma factor [Actinoplanes atraurantiacus]SNY64648.1 RNA polymerase sigma-70 factor, ECF subfamily [Actinoplanes atraurantiacus]
MANENSSRLSALHAEYGDALLSYLRGFTRGDREFAEDLLQETMLRTWRRMDAMPECGEPARRWLYTVARNTAIDALRMRKARPAEVDSLDLAAMPTAEDTAETAVAVQQLRYGLRALSEAHRTILNELYVKGRSVADIARSLGVPAGTVKSRAHYALRSLRESLA